MQQEVEESSPNKNSMPMAHHHQLLSSSSSCYCVDGFDGGACDGEPTVCNRTNQVPCTGDIYDVIGATAAAAVVLKSRQHHHPNFSAADPSFPYNPSGEMAAPATSIVPFTAAQWQELQRQAMIFKYMMGSVPVPPELLIPLTRNPSNVIRGSLESGFSSNVSSNPEPWRCRRTDGKKWRCSRDVAPDQKYCERHSHKSRPLSRKPVELPNHFINNNNHHDHKSQTLNMASDSSRKQPHQNPHFINQTDAHLFTSSFDQPMCLEWFMKGEATVPFASNSNSERQHYKDHRLNLQQAHQNLNEQFNPSLASFGGALNLKQTHSDETRSFIDTWSTAVREVVEMDGIGSKRLVLRKRSYQSLLLHC